jgi:hypothetical protein
MKKHSKKTNIFWKRKTWRKISNYVLTFSQILAIPGTILAFYLAFKEDNKLQKQITDLQTIADESQKQTKLLTGERDTLAIRWKQQIKPVFEIECDYHSGGTSEIEALLVNSGKIATDIKVIQNSGFTVNIPFNNLGEGMKMKILLDFIDKDTLNPENVDLEIKLSFKDASGANCYQIIIVKDFIKNVELKMRGGIQS